MAAWDSAEVDDASERAGRAQGARPSRPLIVTADDFGASLAVNEAIERAHREGILTCASLMVGAEAAADAVQRARRLPSLAVGLHVVLVDGRPVLPAEAVPDLVGADGSFSLRLVRAGVRFFFLPRVRRQLEAEIRAQFEAFRATGLPLDHVNAHKHMHLHPTLLGLILRIGSSYGLRAVRLPHEPLRATLCVSRDAALERLGWSLFIGPWMALLRRRLRRAGVRFNDFVFGLGATGAMTERTLLRILECLPEDGVGEIYFHPGAARHDGPVRAQDSSIDDRELAALTSPRVRTALARLGIAPLAFGCLP
jgi:hopanoid biosynthesis associated protein HpnK